MKIIKIAGLEIDKNTLLVGKFRSVKEARSYSMEFLNKVPRPGYEMTIDSGIVEITEDKVNTVWNGTHKYRYKTYLVNEGGKFRVWTHISSNPESSTGE